MTTAVAPPAPVVFATAPGGAPSVPERRRGAGDGSVACSLRFAAFAALVVYGGAHWARQVAPTATGNALQMAGVAVALAVGLSLAGRLPGARRRRVAAGLLCVAAAIAALTAAGIPLRFVGWRHWDELASGVGEGIAALPNLNIPYRGLDEWVRWVVAAGAALLGVLAAALAFWPTAGPVVRRRLASALVLGVLYGVSIVERNPESPFASGAGFAVLLALFLGADRLAAIGGARPRLIALGGALGALALAALLAPRLDGARPWVDYRGLADDIAQRNQAAFNWNHSYTPLDWPRDGREVLRIKAKEPAYWKATVLRRFDGLRWVHEEAFDADVVDTPLRDEAGWKQAIQVTDRGLRSEEYVAAGFTTRISGVLRPARNAGSGTFRTNGRPLRPGDTYSAAVYTPRPTPRQLRNASTRYPDAVLRDLTMELPERVGGPDAGRPQRDGPQQTTILFPAFGTSTPPTTLIPGRPPFLGGEELLARSGYRRMWAVAQQLRAAASSPFALVRSVRKRVQQGTRYTERPAQRPVPLEAFLFDTREGYCQQFSGAMALMLRMAGVPARVASGFTPGSFDSDRGEYIVRDLDAHSWVEAFFPHIGWVTLDPTPTVAPPAAQETGDGGDSASDPEADRAANRADVPEPAAPAPRAAERGGPGGGGGAPAIALLLGGALVLGLAAAAAWAWRRPRVAITPLEELRRALARSGRAAAPPLTLQALERTLAGTPAAQDYVRKLRLERYAGREEAPTREERAALRDDFAAGLGLRGRLRAIWALPPKLPPRLTRR